MSINPKRTSVTLKLPQLQNLIKRDPAGYREEFEQQKRHFESELEIFKLRPTADSERFTELVGFMAAVCVSYAQCRVLCMLSSFHAQLILIPPSTSLISLTHRWRFPLPKRKEASPSPCPSR